MREHRWLGSYSAVTDQGCHSTCQSVGQAAVPVLGSVRGHPGAQQPGPPGQKVSIRLSLTLLPTLWLLAFASVTTEGCPQLWDRLSAVRHSSLPE